MSTGYDPPPFLRALPSWLSAQLARRGEELVTRALAGDGLRRQHFSVLTSLAEQGSASQATLGRRLSIDRSDLHAILNDLEADGNVRRVRDPQDGRRNVVELTRRGAATRRRLGDRVAA
ncbi:MAG: MarR family winged helix-turn-helix transcriptional regulator, partial [Solirubrobacteraceae bacterium]